MFSLISPQLLKKDLGLKKVLSFPLVIMTLWRHSCVFNSYDLSDLNANNIYLIYLRQVSQNLTSPRPLLFVHDLFVVNKVVAQPVDYLGIVSSASQLVVCGPCAKAPYPFSNDTLAGPCSEIYRPTDAPLLPLFCMGCNYSCVGCMVCVLACIISQWWLPSHFPHP